MNYLLMEGYMVIDLGQKEEYMENQLMSIKVNVLKEKLSR